MHSKKILAATAATLLATGTACAPDTSSSDQAEALMVFGAASTRVLNEELPEASQLDVPMNFVNGGSGSLLQQLEDGAEGDVLITADRQTMDRAVESGVVENPVAAATNSMVIIVPKGNPANITGADESLSSAKVVRCDSKVPCGNITDMLVEKLGLEFTPASQESSVSDVAGKVVSGAADAGWVYRTDAQALADSVDIIEIPGAEEHSNEIMVAAVTSSEKKDKAEDLVDYLASSEADALWSRHGFTPVTDDEPADK